MEIKRKVDFRKVFTGIYIIVAFLLLTFGLRPAEATASHDDIVSSINIPAVGIVSTVTKIKLENHRLETPDLVVGSYAKKNSAKTFLVGHSTTVFRNLKYIKVGDIIAYDNQIYTVDNITIKQKENIDMNELLKSSKNAPKTLIIMTCAGTLYADGDASHRLIVTATLQD